MPGCRRGGGVEGPLNPLGVGPWYYNPKVPIRNFTYRGERFEPHNSVALANAGGLQIELLQPRLILAMGRFAVQALLRTDEPIGRLRGRVHRYHGVPLVVSYHPAYLLRNLPDKARAWEDLCLAAAVAEGTAAS